MLNCSPALPAVRSSARLSSSRIVGRELVAAADHAEADVVLEERVELAAQVVLEQAHERRDLALGPLPVLDREGVEGQHLEAEAGRGLDGVAHGLDAGAVALDPVLAAQLGPAPVAVHDDRDVARQAREVDHAEERPPRRCRRARPRAGPEGTWRLWSRFEPILAPRGRRVDDAHEGEPAGGSGRGPARVGRTPRGRARGPRGCRAPRPAAISPPTMLRTILRRKPSASVS